MCYIEKFLILNSYFFIPPYFLGLAERSDRILKNLTIKILLLIREFKKEKIIMILSENIACQKRPTILYNTKI